MEISGDSEGIGSTWFITRVTLLIPGPLLMLRNTDCIVIDLFLPTNQWYSPYWKLRSRWHWIVLVTVLFWLNYICDGGLTWPFLLTLYKHYYDLSTCSLTIVTVISKILWQRSAVSRSTKKYSQTNLSTVVAHSYEKYVMNSRRRLTSGLFSTTADVNAKPLSLDAYKYAPFVS